MNYDKRSERECEKKKRNMLILCGQLCEVSHKELLLHFLTVEIEKLVFQFVSSVFCCSVHKINMPFLFFCNHVTNIAMEKKLFQFE